MLPVSMVMVQVPVPLQAPLQPAKVEPAAGVAVRVTTLPEAYGSAQSVPQFTPAGLLVTVPLPLPVFVTVNMAEVVVVVVKVAVQVFAAVIVTEPSVQSAFPLQPAKVDPVAGVGVKVTTLPEAYDSVQSVPQFTPVGLLVTGQPFPVFVTVNMAEVVVVVVKVAVQVFAAVIVTEPSVQSAFPLQPAKVDPVAGVGVKVTTLPEAYDSVQSVPQFTPVGLLVTSPFPVFVTVKTAEELSDATPHTSFEGADEPAALKARTR